MKTIIIIGASSGIGYELAKKYLNKGWQVGLVSRQKDPLLGLIEEFPRTTFFAEIDVIEKDNKMKLFLETFNSIDVIINVAGIGFINKELMLDKEFQTNSVNVDGFVQTTIAAINYFEKQGYGHYVNISSMGALIGRAACPAYNASKAYQSNYLEAIRQRVFHKKVSITVTDILPGFVNTGASKLDGEQKAFWMCSTEKAAKQIIEAVKNKKDRAYITKRQVLIAFFVKLFPLWIRKRLK